MDLDFSSSKDALIEAERRIEHIVSDKATDAFFLDLNLAALPESLREARWIKSVTLGGAAFRRLPPWLAEFEHLESISTMGMDGPRIPSVIRELKSLKGLQAVEGSLASIPDWISELSNLEILDLSGNSIKLLPDSILQLHSLRELSLSHNRLRDLPKGLETLPHLERLVLVGNRALHLPSELLRSEIPKEILYYYSKVRRSSDATHIAPSHQPLNEFKLILVGRGGVGKTTLVHKLITDKFEQFDRTDGISIKDWQIKCNKDEVRAHIWDFGGQEIMHGTHRFFMTSRSLYLVLLSARENTEDADAEYWLSIVRTLAGKVPIIIVLNKYKEQPFEVNRVLLREKFGETLRFVECDSLADIGIKELRRAIAETANKMPELRAQFPAEWVKIKNELPKIRQDWMTFEEFTDFCRTRGERKPKACEALASYLHDLGMMLSYRNDEALRGFGVLNPHWVTNGIYRVITSQKLKNEGAKLTIQDFANLLSPTEYPAMVHPYLLALMRKFELCFPLDDSGKRYLVPELLTKEEPEALKQFVPKDCDLGFVYRYESALPHGILPRFLVQTYVHREPRLIWRNGVVLDWGEARGLVRGDVSGRIVHIWIKGRRLQRRQLLAIIRQHFERIHKSYENLPVTEYITIPRIPNVMVKYETLLKYQRCNQPDIIIETGDELRKWPVKELLAEIDDVETRWGFDIPFIPRSGYEFGPLSLFISYSHKDELYRDELAGALTIYERNGELKLWDDTRIEPGMKWEQQITSKLDKAHIIVLLLSNDFIRSDYCTLKEMKRALERDNAGKCAVVPIVVRACAFERLPVGNIQAILPAGKPVKNARDRDTAWREVTEKLDQVISRLRERRTW